MLRIITLLTVLTLGASQACAAGLGGKFSPLEAMHQTPYGSLFFIEDTANDFAIRRGAIFVLIQGDGNLRLPTQSQGYCFAFNHYTITDRSKLSKTYRARIRKTLANGKIKSENFSAEFIPTPIITSPAVPNLCINGVSGVTLIQIEFNSEAGPAFSRTIAFSLVE